MPVFKKKPACSEYFMEGNFFFLIFFKLPFAHVRVQLSRKYQRINPKKPTTMHTQLVLSLSPVSSLHLSLM